MTPTSQLQIKIFDPSKRGLLNANNQVLSTIKNSFDCFSNNPACILRAMKYITSGYTADQELQNALNNESLMKINISEDKRAHLVSMLTKDFRNFSFLNKTADYIKTLQNYWELIEFLIPHAESIINENYHDYSNFLFKPRQRQLDSYKDIAPITSKQKDKSETAYIEQPLCTP